MTDDNPYLQWPGANDRVIVEEMLRDAHSGQWYECNEFVKRLVQVQAKNIPIDYWNDVIQDAMMRIEKSLPTFKFQCSLRSSLFGIVRSSIIDAYRKFKRVGQFIALPGDPHADVEYQEAAKAVGCSAPVAGYVVREAQRYAREKLEHRQ